MLQDSEMPISIAIIAKNEQRTIEACLAQARKLADELILVDSGSTDRTLEIAEKYCDQVVSHDWGGYSKQKNYAISLCKNDWVLSLDADEVLSDDLIEEIKSLELNLDSQGKTEQKNIGYFLSRKLYIGDHFVRFGGYYPDYQLRLFRKDLARFSDSPVHESIEFMDRESGEFYKPKSRSSPLRSKVQYLKSSLDHYSYKDLEDMKGSFDNFAKLYSDACSLGSGDLKNSKHSPLGVLFASLKSIYTFTYRYAFRFGFLEGALGFRMALIHSAYVYKKSI